MERKPDNYKYTATELARIKEAYDNGWLMPCGGTSNEKYCCINQAAFLDDNGNKLNAGWALGIFARAASKFDSKFYHHNSLKGVVKDTRLVKRTCPTWASFLDWMKSEGLCD